ncbi:MAG: hypothetical protein GY950_11565 [bacterium]|nr:hypothetical protein [bacterium]
MTTSAHIALISRQELEKLSREHVELKTGDRLEGEVTRVRGDGKAVIDFGRFQAAVELDVPVSKGDVINVVVESAEKGQQIKLKLEHIRHAQSARSRGEPEVDVDAQKAIRARAAKELMQQVKTQPQNDQRVREEIKAPVNKGEFFKDTQQLPRELQDSLVKLRQILQSSENLGAKDIKDLSIQIKGILDTLQSHGDALDIGEKIAKPVTQLAGDIRSGESGIPPGKEVLEILTKITDAVERLGNLKNIDQLPEIKNIIHKELNPALRELKEIVDREVSKPPVESAKPAVLRPPQEVKQAVDNLLKNVEKALEKLPGQVDTGRTNKDAASIVKQISNLKSMVENAPIPIEKEVVEAVNRLAETAAKISQIKTPEQLPELKPIIDTQLKPDILRLKEAVDLQASRAEPVNRQAARELKQAADEMLKNLEKTLENLPDKLKTSERIETLLKDIKNIRQNLETRSELLDRGSQIVKQVSHLKALVERSDFSVEKEVEAVIARLSEAAENISRVKNPDQLPELKIIIETQLKPNLSALREIVADGPPAPPDPPAPRSPHIPEPETRNVENVVPVENRPTPEEIKQQVETLQRDIELTLKKLPDDVQNSRETKELLKDIQSVLDKIADFSYIAGQEPFTEDIDTLFENIKVALQQLQANVQAGQPLFRLPPEVKDIFANLQLDFSAVDMDKSVSQQITQLTELIDILRDSGFAADKRVEAMINRLTQIVDQLGQLKNSSAPDKWQQVLQNFRQELRPALKSLKQIFSAKDAVPDDVIRDRMTTVSDAVAKMDMNIDGFLEKVSGRARQAQLIEYLEQADHVPKEVKTIFSKLPASLQTQENLSRLSQFIQDPASPLSGEVRQMLSTLRTHFEPLNIGESAVKLVPKLKSIVDDSGIFFEKKIQDVISRVSDASARISSIENLNQLPEIRDIIANDLKPNLLALKEFFNREMAAEPGREETFEMIKKAVEDLLTNINSQQGRAVETQTQQQPMMVFSFNLPIKGEEEAQLKVFYNRNKKKGEEDEFKLSLLLNMDKLGEVRTDFSQWEKNLNITFFVRSYKIKDIIDTHLDEIKEPLGPEFKSLNLKIIVSEEQIAAFDLEPGAASIISDKEVDVKV